MDFERKSFAFKASTDEAKGIVEAVVSVFGNKDSDGDVLVKGAFAGSIQKSKATGDYPPGVWMHDWTQPVCKTLDMWEAEDGLHVKGQFFADDPDSWKAFTKIKNGLIKQYSFGFKTLKDEQKSDARHILDVDMYEWSPVLYGANSSTYTAAVKGEVPATQPLEAHFDLVLATASEFIKRLEAIQEMRAKEGRGLSETKREQVKTLQERLSTLLTLCEEKTAFTTASDPPQVLRDGTEEPKKPTAEEDMSAFLAEVQMNMARLSCALADSHGA